MILNFIFQDNFLCKHLSIVPVIFIGTFLLSFCRSRTCRELKYTHNNNCINQLNSLTLSLIFNIFEMNLSGSTVYY